MRASHVVSLLCSLAALNVGCANGLTGEDPDGAAQPRDDAAARSQDDGATPRAEDAASAPDSAVREADASTPWMPGDPVGDAGAAADTGAQMPPVDAGTAPSDAGTMMPPSGDCPTILSMPGLVFTSTLEAPRDQIRIPATAPSTWREIRVSMDVFLAQWTPKQGQYEVFTLMRGHRWTGNAIGYIALVGPASLSTVMVANLDLPFAAAPDGRRVTRRYAYATGATYHLDYVYDAAHTTRQITVLQGGVAVSSLSATTSVSSVEVPAEGFTLMLGGEEIEGAPDSLTANWRFSNIVIHGCH